MNDYHVVVCAWCTKYYDSLYQDWCSKEEYESVYIVDKVVFSHGICDTGCLEKLLSEDE